MDGRQLGGRHAIARVEHLNARDMTLGVKIDSHALLDVDAVGELNFSQRYVEGICFGIVGYSHLDTSSGSKLARRLTSDWNVPAAMAPRIGPVTILR